MNLPYKVMQNQAAHHLIISRIYFGLAIFTIINLLTI